MQNKFTSSTWLFVGFSGHRRIAADMEPRLRKALADVFAKIRGTAENVRIAAVSSAAEGADLMFVDTFLEQFPKAPWIALLPFQKEEFLNAQSPDSDAPDFSPTAREQARHLLDSMAARIIEIPEGMRESEHCADSENSITTVPGGADEAEIQRLNDCRNRAFVACTRRTVEDSDVLVVIWDGGANDHGKPKPGGTSAAVAYARELGKPVVWIHSTTAEITLPQSLRSCTPQPAAERLCFPENLFELSKNQTLQERKNNVVAILDVFNEKAKRPSRKKRLARLWHTLLITPQLLAVILHQISIAVALASLVWHADKRWLLFALAVELVTLLAALFVIHPLNRKRAAWIENRSQAEICRSARAVWDIKNGESILPALHLPMFESLQRHLFLLRVAWLPSFDHGCGQVCDNYIRERIDDQIEYYRDNGAKAAQLEKKLKLAAHIFTTIAVCLTAFLIFAAAYDTFMDAGESMVRSFLQVQQVVKFVALVLPLVSAAVLASVGALDVGRRAVRYAAMCDYLNKTRPRFKRIDSWPELREAAAEVERILLLEVWEWNTASRFSGQH